MTDDQHEPEAERQGPAPQPFQYASQEQLANERAFAATLADTRDIDVVGRSTTDDRQYLALEMQRRLKVATENLTAEEVRSRESSERLIGLAEALEVSADGLLGEPAPEIRPDGKMYDITPLQRALLDNAPDDPPDIPARPLDVLREEVVQADAALRAADHATAVRLLGRTIGELCVHAAADEEPDRQSALKILISAYGSEGTCALRQIGESNLAWIAGERARQAAELLGDPVWKPPPRSAAHTPAAPRTSRKG